LGLRLLWGYIASSGQNLTSYSSSATLISYKGDEISRISRIVSKIWCGTHRRQTDRWQTQQPKQKALILSVRA